MDLLMLGAVLRERRETLGIPRTEIARRVGVTPTYIWLVEGARPRKSGEPSRPAQALLERWSKALGMEDRYTRQILMLGGYGIPPEIREALETPDVASPTPPRSPTVARMSTLDERVPAQAFQMAPGASRASAKMESFADTPMYFPQPRDLQTEVLLDRVRGTLSIASRSDRDWTESTDLLDSFLAWLHFRLEGTLDGDR